MRDSRRPDYERFWKAFGPVLKEGIVVDREHAESIASLMLCASSRQDAPTTLDEYVSRLAQGQESIYVLAAESVESARRSPHLEALAARGWEALLFVDPVDEWVLERWHEYKGRKIVRLERGDAAELGGEAERFDRERREREHRALLERMETELASGISKVRFSTRLKDSPAVLVDDPDALGPAMERMLRHSGQEPPPRKRILELNPTHPLIERLAELHAADARSPRIKDWSDLVHGQALLAEGSALPDPARFGRLVTELMLSVKP
jgi:molecular chaperone HtpG